MDTLGLGPLSDTSRDASSCASAREFFRGGAVGAAPTSGEPRADGGTGGAFCDFGPFAGGVGGGFGGALSGDFGGDFGASGVLASAEREGSSAFPEMC